MSNYHKYGVKVNLAVSGTGQMKRGAKAVHAVGSAAGSAAGNLRALSGAFTGLVVAKHVGRTFNAFIQPARQMEGTLLRLQVITGRTGAGLLKLKTAAEQAAFATTFGPQQAIDVLEVLTRATGNAASAMTALKSTMTTAMVAGIDPSEAGKMTGKMIKGFNLVGDSVGMAQDQMFGLSKSIGVTMQEMTKVMGSLSMSAEMGNQNFRSTMQSFMMTARIMNSPMRAATRLRRLFQDMGTTKAAEGMEQVGIRLQDVNGKIRPIMEVMIDMASKFKEEPVAMREAILDSFSKASTQPIFAMMRGLNRGVALMGQNMKTGRHALEAMNSALDGSAGSLKRASDTMMDSPGNTLTLLSEAANTLKRSFGEVLLEILKPFAATLKIIAQGINSFSQYMGGFGKGVFAVVAKMAMFKSMLFGTKALLDGMSRIFRVVKGNNADFMASIFGTTKAIEGENAALAQQNALLTGNAVAKGQTSFAGMGMGKKSGGGAAVGKLGILNVIGGSFASLGEMLSRRFKQAFGGAKSLVGRAGGAIRGPIGRAGGALSGMAGEGMGMLSSIGRRGKLAGGYAKAGLGSVGRRILATELGKEMGQSLKMIMPDPATTKAVRDAFGSIAPNMQRFGSGLKRLGSGLGRAATAVGGFAKRMFPSGNTLKSLGMLKSVLPQIAMLLFVFYDDIKGLVKGATDSLTELFAGGDRKTLKAMSDINTKLDTKLLHKAAKNYAKEALLFESDLELLVGQAALVAAVLASRKRMKLEKMVAKYKEKQDALRRAKDYKSAVDAARVLKMGSRAFAKAVKQLKGIYDYEPTAIETKDLAVMSKVYSKLATAKGGSTKLFAGEGAFATGDVTARQKIGQMGGEGLDKFWKTLKRVRAGKSQEGDADLLLGASRMMARASQMVPSEKLNEITKKVVIAVADSLSGPAQLQAKEIAKSMGGYGYAGQTLAGRGALQREVAGGVEELPWYKTAGGLQGRKGYEALMQGYGDTDAAGKNFTTDSEKSYSTDNSFMKAISYKQSEGAMDKRTKYQKAQSEIHALAIALNKQSPDIAATRKSMEALAKAVDGNALVTKVLGNDKQASGQETPHK